MRIRARYDGMTIFWILLSITQIAIIIDRIHRSVLHRSTGWMILDRVSLATWAFALTLHGLHPLFNYWKVEPTGIRYRKLWLTKEIPFTQIAAIRPVKIHGGTVEIEVARRGKDIYPHQYLIADPTNREAFLQAIETHAPQTLLEA